LLCRTSPLRRAPSTCALFSSCYLLTRDPYRPLRPSCVRGGCCALVLTIQLIVRATDEEFHQMIADIQPFYAIYENVGSGYTCCAQSGVDSMTDNACVSRQTACGIAPPMLLIIANISTSTFRSNASLCVISSTSSKRTTHFTGFFERCCTSSSAPPDA
jgi:hypothetical protein